jgi:hypothetical protein
MTVEGDCEVARAEVGGEKKTSRVIGSYSETDKSFARIRLLNAENPSVCATVNWEACKIVIELYCL